MTETLQVSRTYPASWRADPAVPLLASEPWHNAMSGRFEGQPVWFWTPASNNADETAPPSVGLTGYVLAEPADYPLADALRVAAGPSSPFADEVIRTLLGDIERETAVWYPYLLLTCPGYATFPVGRAARDVAAVRRTLAAVLDWSRAKGLQGVALPYTEAVGPLASAARELGSVGPVIGADSQLAVDTGGFVPYLERFEPKRRRKLRAERRALHSRGLRGRRAGQVTDPLLDRLAELRCRHREKYGLPATPASERTRIAGLVGPLESRTDIITVGGEAEDGSDAVSFGLFVRDRDVWHAVYTGNDYRDPRSRNAYFEAVYYAPVELAGPLGINHISYGLAADRAKKLRGCTSVPVTCLLLGLTQPAKAVAAQVVDAWNHRTPTTADNNDRGVVGAPTRDSTLGSTLNSQAFLPSSASSLSLLSSHSSPTSHTEGN